MSSHKNQSKQQAKKHHYLTAAYLAGFTPSGNKDDYLHVFDLVKRESRRSKPETEACQNHLYTVEALDIPDTFERLLAREESDILPVIKSVCQKKHFSASELDQLLRFIALTLARLPSTRDGMKVWLEQRSGQSFEETVRDPNAWLWLSEWLKLPLDCVFTKIRQLMSNQSDNLQLWHVLVIDPLYKGFLKLLKERIWSLCIAPQGEQFVCTDNPVGAALPMDYITDENSTFGNPATILTFPLDRHAALVGGLYDFCCVEYVTNSAVVEINTQTLRRAKRFAFAPSTEFSFAVSDGTIQKGEALLKLVKPMGVIE